MRALPDRVRRTIRAHEMVEPGSRLVAAVSGGSDSVALLHLLNALSASGEFVLAGVAHFNHRLRETAGRDEAFCRRLADALGLPIDVEWADVAALAAERRQSIEVAAREARHAFFVRAAARAGADRVALGHTRDDQAETFLLRLLRGAGSRGLGAMRPRAGLLVRPLLDVGRDELRAYLTGIGASWCEDETNADLANPRNRIRHELLPYLSRHLAPDVTAVLARAAALARDDEDFLDAAAIETAPGIVLSTGEAAHLDVRGLLGLHPAVARRVVRRVLVARAAGRFVGFDHVEAVLGLARGRSEDAAVDLPGQRAEREGGRIVLGPAADRSDKPGRKAELALEPRELPVPGVLTLDELGWALTTEPVPVDGVKDLRGLSSRGLQVAVDRAALAEPLAVRTRRPGDSLRPIGVGGRKKLQDLLVDRKVRRNERDRVPLVVDAEGRLVWVVGHALAEEFRVTEASAAVIFLKASRLGGQG
jgi:tRNA(Ile)-lysidine synthase